MKKLFIISAAIFLLASGCNRNQAIQRNSEINEVKLQPIQTNQQASTTKPNTQTQTKQNAGGQDYFPKQEPGGLTVQQTVEGSNLNQLNTEFKQGETAMDVLKREHKVETKNFGSGMGEMVISIDGIKPDSQHFWEFMVNGKFSNVGASLYILNNGDQIEWKLEKINSSAQ